MTTDLLYIWSVDKWSFDNWSFENLSILLENWILYKWSCQKCSQSSWKGQKLATKDKTINLKRMLSRESPTSNVIRQKTNEDASDASIQVLEIGEYFEYFSFFNLSDSIIFGCEFFY